MSESRLDNRVREARERMGLSQSALAERVGVSRQAVLAIEAGRQVPSTALGLRIARALRTSVEELFRLSGDEGLDARLAPAEGDPGLVGSRRVTLARVGGVWVAHRLPHDASLAADGLLVGEGVDRAASVRALVDERELRRNVLVAGCAPLLGALAHRVGNRSADARATWLGVGSGRSMELLRDGLVHVAGVHGGGSSTGDDNAGMARTAFPGAKTLLVNLTRWRLGVVVPAGNPLTIRSGADFLRPGLRVARREPGTGAHKLLLSLAAAEGVDRPVFHGPHAAGHEAVAQLVRCGAADVGIAIEAVALASGLGFVPLLEERFDLVVPGDLAAEAPVSRLLDALDDPAFRADAAELPGYDTSSCGHVTTLEAA
jgi:molybdate-binding protein/DNA-binding XRE family transcriptional regulator